MKEFGAFEVSVEDNGVATVIFSRPPVNAVSISVYENIGDLSDYLNSETDIRVVILTAPESSRAWCGGADVNDFVGMNVTKRKERYQFINEKLPRFYNIEKPVIAAINSHAVGIGMVLSALCDMRVAAEEAKFSCPEINFGLVAGGAGLFAMLKMPEAKIREVLFTGRKFSARELESTGFLNYVVPLDQVLGKAREIAYLIAEKSLPAIRARKVASVNLEGRTWMEAYLDAQELSGSLVENADSSEGVSAFLQKRRPDYKDS